MSDYEISRKLRDCLVQLTEGKVSERKKQLDNLKTYLMHPAYLKHMNKSSAKDPNIVEKGIISISWKKVFSRIKDYIEQECTKYREKEGSNENLSAIVRNNIAKEKRCCSDLFRCFVKAMKLNKQYEMATPVVLHILAVLNQPFTQVAFGIDYSNVFLKYILCDPFMYLNLTSDTLNDAVWFYHKFIKNPPSDWNRSLMTQILFHLVTIRSNMGEWNCLKLLEFFIYVFDDMKYEKASKHHENLLRCLLLACQILRSDYPLYLCYVGELILLPIMQLWKTRPSEKSQELMLEFMRFQLALHHPKGIHKDQNGARAKDWQCWKNQLIGFYKLIMAELNSLCEKNKYPFGKESILKPVFISVTVEICGQVFVESVGILDITQASTTFDTMMPSKKRRLDVSFKALVDNLASSKIIPWLQVISGFLVKYSIIISIPEAHYLLDALMDVHMSCNDIETKNWLLYCCHSFVQAFGNNNIIDKDDISFQWQRLWELAVKSVALMHQCQEAGHSLLTSLLCFKLITPKAEFCNLYTPGSSNRVTKSSLITLAMFLEKFPSSSIFGHVSNSSRSLSSESFENQVLEWLFSRKNDDNSPFQVISEDVDLSTYAEFARVAALLCMQNNEHNENFETDNKISDPFYWISEVEEELLLLSFSNPPNQTETDVGKYISHSSIVVPPIWDRILKFFIEATGGIFQEHICNIQFSTISSFIRYACLLFEMFQQLYFKGIIKQVDLESNIFVSYLRKSLHAVVEMLKKDETNVENIIFLKKFLQHIISVIDSSCQKYGQTFSEAFVLQILTIIPEDLLNHILNFSLNSYTTTVSDAQSNGEVDEIFDPFAESTKKIAMTEKDDLDFELKLEKNSVQLMDTTNLSENTQLQLECLEILGQYSNLLLNNLNGYSCIMLKKLISALPNKDHRFRNAADVHMTLQLLKCILLNKSLDEEVIDKVLYALRLILNQLSQMQDLNIVVLKLFPLLLDHVYDRSPVVLPNASKYKFRMLHLIYVLCKRELEEKGSAFASFYVVQILMKIVQIEPNASWQIENKSGKSTRASEQCNLIIDSLIEFMNSPSTCVRLSIATNINKIISKEVSDRIFQEICMKTVELLKDINPNESLSNTDEYSNRMSTFLHYLMQVILMFPCLEIESIFMMFKCIKYKLAGETLVSLVLKQVANSLGYKNIQKFFEPRLSYLSQRWFEAKYKLEEIPVCTLGEKSFDSFIRKYHKILVPQLFYVGDMESVTTIAGKMNMSLPDIFLSCLPNIMPLVLADLALNRNTTISTKCKDLLYSIIPIEICKRNIMDKLNEFVISLLSMIKENLNDHTSMCRLYSKHYICTEEFMKIITYTMSYTDYKEPFPNFLMLKMDCVPNIFLAINIMLYEALRPHEARRILCMYQCFLRLLLPGLINGMKCSAYITQEIIYSVINFLTDKREYIKRDEVSINYCTNLLFSLCKEAVQSFNVIGEFLPFVVSNLTPFVNNTISGKNILSFLEFLIIECEEYLVQYIPYLDPFPNENIFSNLAKQQKCVKYKHGKFTLKQEIQFFLISCKMMGRATKSGLEHICNQLNSEHVEFQEILENLKEKTVFTEDVKESILHELVCQLASLCSPSNDFEIQKAASQCLGVIGPVCFSSVVLQPSSHAMTKKDHENLNFLGRSYANIFSILTEYLFHKSIHIKVAASKVLKDVLCTKKGYLFFKEYSKLFPNSNVVKCVYPFFASQNPKDLKQSCKYELNVENFEISIWLPNSDGHSMWIMNLVCTILENGLTKNSFFECLIPICKEEASFCEKIIPYLIHMILLIEDVGLKKILFDGVSLFFSRFSQWVEKNSTSKEFSSFSPTFTFPKISVQTMLSILHYIWLHPKQNDKRNVIQDLWLNISYLDVAQAAQYCSAYFTAILYTELWCDLEREKSRLSCAPNNFSDSGSLGSSPLSFIGSQDQEKSSLVYHILLDSYSHIGDSDAISGCDLITTDSQAILKHNYLIDQKWDGLLKLNDKQNSKYEILQALQFTGLNNILLGYSQSLLTNKSNLPPQEIIEYQCQAAWRMGQWNLPIFESSSNGFQEYLYRSQQSFVLENKPMFNKYLNLARKTQFECLNSTSLESARNIMPVLSNMQMISVLEDFSEKYSNSDSLIKLLDAWKIRSEIIYEDFQFVEPVSWLKCVLLNYQVNLNVNKHIIIPQLKKLLECHCMTARNELFLEVASSALNSLRKLPCVEKHDELHWQIEEAKILWTQKEYSIANKILKSTLHIIQQAIKENSEFSVNYGEALTLRGKWLAETCNENSSVIMRDYLEKAVDVLENIDCTADKRKSSAIWDAFLAVARYADAQYQSIVNYKKSTAYQTKQELMESSKLEAKKLKTKASTEDQRKTHLIITKQLMIDQEELNSVEQDQKQFLDKAIHSYLKCLKGTDAHDLWVFRLVSLWFQNFTDEGTNNLIQYRINELQCYKFLPLMYQLAARMGSQVSSTFTNTLTNLLVKIAVDHPHHALPVILALSNANKDPVDGQKDLGHSSTSQQSDVSSVKSRMEAAKKIIFLLSKSKISTLIKGYNALCDAYITLAYHPVEKQTKKGLIPSDQPLLKCRNLHNIPIITEEVKVDRSCEYKNLIGVYSFNPEFRLCGGITLPKVIKCLGTDGIEREQLVKGRDDLRQDAVMQQVFCLVNHLLERETETNRRRLQIRTYKVVPVSRRSGVLQWCEGTQVLSHYLIGNNGAHARYYPHMASHLDCRRKMEAIASVSLLQKKREIFDNICANYPPVFRYFFIEHFPEPSAWFERRLCYTKSVAASSIVGYILGLGDRHVNNILIDKNTAEVVHIDFGIAFEKGRILATPETVPFRLTRDIVDGMGISGVEGTFKRCSEKTLEVMRKSQDVLLTILDVLIQDPLYEWTVPPSKSPSQTSSKVQSQEVNKLAERALMRLQQKLQGFEEGVAMSIEGQVNLLIQQARDPNNLCRIYAGWQPYL